MIDVVYRDEAGQRLADEPFFINHVRSGENVVERQSAFSRAGTICAILEVERISAESPDDVAEVTCEVTGVDAIGDIAVRFVATNGSSGVSDYLINAALIRDGLRVGTAFGSVENVAPGESAPTGGFSWADGPADGVTCETVHVQRMAS